MSEIEFANTPDEAVARYEKYKSEDPFPFIFPALLSSAQIEAYIAKTGMIYPYSPSTNEKDEKVTSACLEMTIGPEVLYWDAENKRQYHKDLEKGAPITLRPNSITFLRPAECFHIPDYIAVRFNLRIVHVHRGLLLGTGPIVDPGFKGYPMIPVHNLTENEYEVNVGDQFINVEFTKFSTDIQYKLSSEKIPNIPFKYKKNRGKTFDFDFTEYIAKHVPQRKVKSSLSAVIDHARGYVDEQQKQAKIDLKEQKKWTKISVIVALVSIAALVYGGLQLTISATDIINDARERIEQSKEQEIIFKHLQESVHKLEKEIQYIKEMATMKTIDGPEEIGKGKHQNAISILPPESHKELDKKSAESKEIKKD